MQTERQVRIPNVLGKQTGNNQKEQKPLRYLCLQSRINRKQSLGDYKGKANTSNHPRLWYLA